MHVRSTTALRGEILSAARAEFAQYGLAGGRIDRIARTAHASKERLYAHFGDKETLFRDVVAADSAEFFSALTPRPDAIAELAGDIYDLARSHPEHYCMMDAPASGGSNGTTTKPEPHPKDVAGWWNPTVETWRSMEAFTRTARI